MSYLKTLESANLTHGLAPAAAPSPHRHLADALATISAWAAAWQGRQDIIDRYRALPGGAIDAQVADLTREHAAAMVDAALNRNPLPDPIGDRIAALRHEAETAQAERESLRLAASTLLAHLAEIFRANTDTVAAHLHTRLGKIIAQARELGVAPADIPNGNTALRLGEEQRGALLHLEELAADLAEVRAAQASAFGVRELAAHHCFANAEEFHAWGQDEQWPGALTRPDAAHLAWVATTPGVRAWVPTAAQAQEGAARFKAAHDRAEYEYLRRQRADRGSLGAMQEQRLAHLERIVEGESPEDMSPSENHRPRPEVAAARRRHETRARAEAHRPAWR